MLKIASFSPINYVTQCNVVKILLALCDFTVVSKCNFLIKKLHFGYAEAIFRFVFVNYCIIKRPHVLRLYLNHSCWSCLQLKRAEQKLNSLFSLKKCIGNLEPVICSKLSLMSPYNNNKTNNDWSKKFLFEVALRKILLHVKWLYR